MKFDWRDWKYTTVSVHVRREGTSNVFDVSCDDGEGGLDGFTTVPTEVKQKVLEAIRIWATKDGPQSSN